MSYAPSSLDGGTTDGDSPMPAATVVMANVAAAMAASAAGSTKPNKFAGKRAGGAGGATSERAQSRPRTVPAAIAAIVVEDGEVQAAASVARETVAAGLAAAEGGPAPAPLQQAANGAPRALVCTTNGINQSSSLPLIVDLVESDNAFYTQLFD